MARKLASALICDFAERADGRPVAGLYGVEYVESAKPSPAKTALVRTFNPAALTIVAGGEQGEAGYQVAQRISRLTYGF